MELIFKLLPSTEKCFWDEKIENKPELTTFSMLKNEKLDFQLAYASKDLGWHSKFLSLEIESDIKSAVSVSRIENVPVNLPIWMDATENDGFLRTEPGLYPDLLIPMEDQNKLIFSYRELRSLMITVENTDGIPAGEHYVTLKAMDGETCMCSATAKITVVDAFLPELELVHTEWFHCDCLASYYDVPVFSERHWEIIETYMREAAYHGVNLILTPVFTPPIDTAIGGERLTVQLTDVTVTDNGYEFGFSRFDRWVELAKNCGMKYFEISHLFTQWGCKYAPKVIANVNGEEKRIFGWETDALSDEYRTFIRAFLTAFVAHAKELGIIDKCYFHISDEPHLDHLESYKKAKEMIYDIVGEYPMMDALSSYEFYETGAVKIPVPSTNHISPFIENNVTPLYTYYCCGQYHKVSNRFLSMPGARTRILGTQLFKYDVVGFLQWGFNFYNCQFSNYPINPYVDTCGEHFVPAGDAYLVYPGPKGKPYRSLHGMQFLSALTDLRAFKLLSSLIGKEKTMAIIEEGIDPITFDEYPMDQEYLIRLREKINSAIAEALKA